MLPPMLDRVRLVLDLIGLLSVALGVLVPALPPGSTRRRVASALGAVLPEAMRALRERFRQ